jgi:phage tail sheath protein FI
MSEDQVPGQFIEEAAPGAPPIEGVVGTAGFIGPTGLGPTDGASRPLGSFDDFERIYGAADPLSFGPNHLAHAARAFFAEGGRRLYVARVVGDGGLPPSAADYAGEPGRVAGLFAFDAGDALDEVAFVAAPGSTELPDAAAIRAVLVEHGERTSRVAVLDVPAGADVGGARTWRAGVTSSWAALYYPWVETIDPAGAGSVLAPPSGFVAGVWAREDLARSPASSGRDEGVRSAAGLERPLTTQIVDVLNPEGVNVLRVVPGRGTVVWGGRTLGDDPEWTYVAVRRYVAYLERSIERGTRWAVFEPNDEGLWRRVASAVREFLSQQWNAGGMVGSRPDEAFFVRCDRTTMTEDDIANGRLVLLAGVAPLRPAEFVIVRIQQLTASGHPG